jgi:hypothetical protein
MAKKKAKRKPKKKTAAKPKPKAKPKKKETRKDGPPDALAQANEIEANILKNLETITSKDMSQDDVSKSLGLISMWREVVETRRILCQK